MKPVFALKNFDESVFDCVEHRLISRFNREFAIGIPGCSPSLADKLLPLRTVFNK